MAEEENPYKKLLETPDSMPDAAPMRNSPLTDEERMVVQNFFDTQPKRRAQYLMQLGFEMNPKDDNEYRPAGSQGSWGEVDGGWSAFFKKGALAEMKNDIRDASFDVAVQGLLAGAGAVAGSQIPVLGTVVGGVLGGALGNAASEGLKNAAGDLFLDKEIPQDMKLTALQSLVVGSAPAIGKLGKNLGSGAISHVLESRKKAIINAAKASGGGVTAEILEKAAREPELFTDEAVSGATKRLEGEYKSIFGVSPDSPLVMKSTRQVNPESAFGKALKPLNDEATEEVNKLAASPIANWHVDELTGPMKREISVLADKFDRTVEEDAALKYLRDKVSYVTKNAGAKGEINFKQGREVLKAIQDDAFNREIPGASYIKQAIGGRPDALRALADQKAAAVGSKLPEINAKRSQILQTFETARQNLTPGKITSAYVGDNSIQKLQTQEALGLVDSVLGTEYGKSIQTAGEQRVIENLYRNPKAFGSGRVLPEIVQGAASGALQGAGAGGGIGAMLGQPALGAGVGGAVGAIGGARKAARYATPENALEALGNITAAQAGYDKLANEALSKPATYGAIEVGAEAARNVTPMPEEENPYKKLLGL